MVAGCVGDDSDDNPDQENGESETPENGTDDGNEMDNGDENGDDDIPENGTDNGDEETPENGMDNGDEETPENGEDAIEADAEVAVRGSNVFEPTLLKLEVGETLRWVGEGSSHTVTFYHEANDRQHRTPEGVEGLDASISNGEEVVFTFEEPGVYDYYCSPHESTGMVGSVIVGETDNPEQPGLKKPGEDIPDAAASALEGLNFDTRDTLGMEQPPWAEIVEPAGILQTGEELQIVIETNLEPETDLTVTIASEPGARPVFFIRRLTVEVMEDQRATLTVDLPASDDVDGTATIKVRETSKAGSLAEREFELE